MNKRRMRDMERAREMMDRRAASSGSKAAVAAPQKRAPRWVGIRYIMMDEDTGGHVAGLRKEGFTAFETGATERGPLPYFVRFGYR